MASTRTSYDLVVLAGDIGGTNINLALIGKKGGTFTIIFEGHYKTRDEISLIDPLRKFLTEGEREIPSFRPELCCLSGAGPVVDGTIALTNASWGIDEREIERAFGLKTRVINDFTAVSYGVVLLDPLNPDQITRLAHCDGSFPEPRPGVRAIIGAGTGLGVGYVVKVHDRIEAFPSEGGHATFPAFDDETRDLQAWLSERFGFVPGAEAGVSGQGITNIFAWLVERGEKGRDATVRAILDASEAERPALISAAAPRNPICAACMDLFVKLYARVAADLTATLLPSGGVFLAGGIAAKNEAFFIEERRFMTMFEKSYREHIRAILVATPVMIVKDYSISLYGAANAAVSAG
jgi:glucokinase